MLVTKAKRFGRNGTKAQLSMLVKRKRWKLAVEWLLQLQIISCPKTSLRYLSQSTKLGDTIRNARLQMQGSPVIQPFFSAAA